MFGEVVRVHRRRSGVTQEELAERTGLSVRSIGKIEAGRIVAPRPRTMRRLADAFGLTGADRDRFYQIATGDPEPVPRPAQLPIDTAMFVGRAEALRRLDELASAADRPDPAPVVIAIDGLAGVGKTALAVRWAHRVADRYPDGQLYVNLLGFDPTGFPMTAAEALAQATRGLELFGTAGDAFWQRYALNLVGWYHTQLGRHDTAIALCEQALLLMRSGGDRHGEAAVWDSLGHAHGGLGHHAEALRCYGQALAGYRDVGDKRNEGEVLDHEGDARCAAGDVAAARAAWQQALDILTELHHPDAGKVRAKLPPAGERT